MPLSLLAMPLQYGICQIPPGIYICFSYAKDCKLGSLQITCSKNYKSLEKEGRLRWYGHMEHSNGAVKTAFDIQVDRKHGPGRPKMTWRQLTERDCREWKLTAINPHDRDTWRSGVRSAMLAASQLPGRGPTDVDIAPVPAR